MVCPPGHRLPDVHLLSFLVFSEHAPLTVTVVSDVVKQLQELNVDRQVVSDVRTSDQSLKDITLELCFDSFEANNRVTSVE